MKPSLLTLLARAGIAHATPTVLSLTQSALQKIDPDVKPDHYEIARTDLNADGQEDVLALMNGKSGYTGSGGATLFVLKSDNRPIEMDVSGIVTQVEVADINADGSPELYVHGFDGKSQTLLA